MISWFKAQYDELNPFGRFFFGLGFVSLCVAAGMTFKFGWTMSVLHALGLGVLSIVASFLPEAAYRLGEDGKGALAGAIAIAALPLTAVEYFSHVGYTVGQRVENTQQAGVHNTKFEDARKSLASDEANLAMWKEHLEKLKGENPWVTSVSADGLKAQVATADEAIKQEERRGGCGPICLGLMKEKAGLEERIALAAQASKLSEQIEATQRIVDGKTEVASKATFESSPVVNQTAFVAKLVGMSLEPDAATQEGSQIGISASLAFANVLLTPICFLVAGRNRKTSEGGAPAQASRMASSDEAGPVERIVSRQQEPRVVRQTFTDRRALEILAGIKRDLLARPTHA